MTTRRNTDEMGRPRVTRTVRLDQALYEELSAWCRLRRISIEGVLESLIFWAVLRDGLRPNIREALVHGLHAWKEGAAIEPGPPTLADVSMSEFLALLGVNHAAEDGGSTPAEPDRPRRRRKT